MGGGPHGDEEAPGTDADPVAGAEPPAGSRRGSPPLSPVPGTRADPAVRPGGVAAPDRGGGKAGSSVGRRGGTFSADRPGGGGG
jgi:hypothetical protein